MGSRHDRDGRAPPRPGSRSASAPRVPLRPWPAEWVPREIGRAAPGARQGGPQRRGGGASPPTMRETRGGERRANRESRGRGGGEGASDAAQTLGSPGSGSTSGRGGRTGRSGRKQGDRGIGGIAGWGDSGLGLVGSPVSGSTRPSRGKSHAPRPAPPPPRTLPPPPAPRLSASPGDSEGAARLCPQGPGRRGRGGPGAIDPAGALPRGVCPRVRAAWARPPNPRTATRIRAHPPDPLLPTSV